MAANLDIVIAGGGAAGWLTACYLQKALGARATEQSGAGAPTITVIESPDIGIIGVGEGTFPTIRTTLTTLGIDEARFLRESNATFKQGIRFDDWARTSELCLPLRRVSVRKSARDRGERAWCTAPLGYDRIGAVGRNRRHRGVGN